MPLERAPNPLELSEAQAEKDAPAQWGWGGVGGGVGRCSGGVPALGQLSETAGQPPVALDASQET